MFLNKLSKKTLIYFSISCLLFLALLAIYSHYFNLKNSFSINKNPSKENITITDVTYSKNVLLPNDLIDIEIKILNPQKTKAVVFLGHSISSPINEWFDLPVTRVELPSNNTKTLKISLDRNDLVFKKLISGSYSCVFALWTEPPSSSLASRINEKRISNAFRIYSKVENFNLLRDDIWFSRNGKLGRSNLENSNVGTSNDKLTIKLPGRTLNGGEIQSIDMVHYGSYEISMLLPDSPSSITGFFLYKAPDFHHEIDIEVFNSKEGKVLLTSYSKGKKRNEAILPLNFNPTSSFNRYRIDYYPDKLSFYINDFLIQTWSNGFSKEPMHLMVNAWYPVWLEGIAPSQDKYLIVDWIRY